MENFINTLEGKIHYYDSGKGEPVLLIHGYLETADIWNSFAEKISRDFRVLAIDLPGHGQSYESNNAYSIEALAEVVKNVLDSLSIDKVFLIGHSLGGYIVLAFLELFRDKLTGYCLFHSHPFEDTLSAIDKRNHEIALASEGKKDLFYPGNVTRMYAEENQEKFPDALSRSLKIASGISVEGITAVLNAMKSRPSRVSVMEEGHVPCLWILGRMDNHIDCDTMLKRVSLPSNAEVVILERSGHMGFIEEEARSVEIISEFVGKVYSL